jgi:DNA invertase Pin-like site-specific DNA recombinase
MPRLGPRAPNDPSRVVGYIVPFACLALEEQLNTLRQWCVENHAELLRVVSETKPHRLGQRVALAEALDHLQVEMAGVLLVACRGVVADHAIEWAVVNELTERQGGQLLSAAGDTREWADDLFVAREAFRAYLELRQGLPIRRGVRERRRQGLSPGGEPPYGFRHAEDESRLVPDEAEQAVIRLVLEQRAQKRTLKQIAEGLAARGIQNRAGRPFDASTLSRMVARAREEKP